jgi:hypothetical protein
MSILQSIGLVLSRIMFKLDQEQLLAKTLVLPILLLAKIAKLATM